MSRCSTEIACRSVSVSGDFDSTILQRTSHRPWSLPVRPWTMTQTWTDLLFAHWAVPPARLSRLLPPGLTLDTYAGSAWLGIVPFRMRNVGVRGWTPLPGVATFPELNVRTYVRVGDKPGVYFFSLDASNPIAVAAARLLGLPYFPAAMDMATAGHDVSYRSRRRLGPAATWSSRYRPVGEASEPPAGSLNYFLTERYCLYAPSVRGRLRRLEIHHPPWRLHQAHAEIGANTMTRSLALPELSSQPDLLHYSHRQDAVAWYPTSLGSLGATA